MKKYVRAVLDDLKLTSRRKVNPVAPQDLEKSKQITPALTGGAGEQDRLVETSPRP